MEERYTHENGEPSAMKVASSVRRGVHAPADRNVGWSEPTLLLGAMLASLAFGDVYKTEGSYVTIIVMNFVIAIAMLATPLFVKSLGSQGAQAMSSGLWTAPRNLDS